MKPSAYDIPKEVFARNQEAFKEMLSKRHFDMLRLRTEDEMTHLAIAKVYGLSKERIRQILAKTHHILEQAGYVGQRTRI